MRMMDKKLSLLAGKILLYLAENLTVSIVCLLIRLGNGFSKLIM